MDYDSLYYSSAPLTVDGIAEYLFMVFLTISIILLLVILFTPQEPRRPGLYERFLNWWDDLWKFPMYDYNQLNEHTKGVSKSMHYGNWNCPSYRDVWVQNYIKQADGSYKELFAKMGIFVNIDGKHEWGWIATKGEYGWKCPAPPAEPKVLMSEGLEEDIIAILAEYNANKITAKTYALPKSAAKSTNSTEIDRNKQQNAKIA